jgi:hypothetical protein
MCETQVSVFIPFDFGALVLMADAPDQSKKGIHNDQRIA